MPNILLIIPFLLFAGIASAQSHVLHLCQESTTEEPVHQNIVIQEQTYAGEHAAIAAHALYSKGIDFTLVRLPWKRCMAKALEGEMDGVIGMGWTEERGQQFRFPLKDQEVDENLRLRYVNYPIYTLNSSRLKWDGKRLSNVRYGLSAPKGFIVEEKLKAFSALQKMDLGVSTGFSLLQRGRVDGMVLSEEVGDKMVAEENKGNIIKLRPYFYRQPIFLIFSPKQKSLTDEEILLLWQQVPASRTHILGNDTRY